MIRNAALQDIPRIAEIIVFGKRTTYRPITDNAVEICDFYVEPFFKGQGIGKRLLQYVIDDAKEAGKAKVCLMVLQDNLGARKFYEHHGFQETGETGFFAGTSVVDVYYELKLCGQTVYLHLVHIP